VAVEYTATTGMRYALNDADTRLTQERTQTMTNQPLRNLVDLPEYLRQLGRKRLQQFDAFAAYHDAADLLQALIDQSCNVSLMACEPLPAHQLLNLCAIHQSYDNQGAEMYGTFDAQKPERVCKFVYSNGVSVCNAIEKIHGNELGMISGHEFSPEFPANKEGNQ
tara:strand:- start:28 stop:522 length:495 start_codon:yes stop_codon:yes gene_type:complete